MSREFLWTLSKCRTLDVSDSCTLLLEAVDPTLDMTCRNFPVLVDCGSSRQELCQRRIPGSRFGISRLSKGPWTWGTGGSSLKGEQLESMG